MRPEFVAFNKIPRLRRDVIITEKIDGTNAQVHVTAEGEVYAGSRNRWITPEADNFGFACWVKKHETDLAADLGPGTHFGEWWGCGIGRNYGLSERRFSLFNTSKWKGETVPRHCSVVPVVAMGVFSERLVELALDDLRVKGSLAEQGFMKAEGVVVFMCASASMHKILLEGDELPKGFLTHQERELAKTSGTS